MSTTITEIQELCQAIQQETQNGSITAARLGSLLILMADKLEENESSYHKPSGGIPKTDLAAAVRTSLGKADAAYQKPSGGIPYEDMSSAVKTSLDKADTALQQHQDISGLAEAVNVADYTTEDAEMPKGALYHYNGLPVHSRNILVDDGDIDGNVGDTTDCVIICLHNEQSAETHGSMYYVFANTGAKLKYVHQWEYASAPEYVKEVFGESEIVSTESAMDALPTTIDGRGVRSIKKGGKIVYPVTHADAVIYDNKGETTVKDEVEALKNNALHRVVTVEYWDSETPAMHKDGASAGELFYKTDEGKLYEYYQDQETGEMTYRGKALEEGAIYLHSEGREFGIAKKIGGQVVMHVIMDNTITIVNGDKKVVIAPEYVSVEDGVNTMLITPDCIDVGGPTLTQGTLTQIATMFNYGKSKGWWN